MHDGDLHVLPSDGHEVIIAKPSSNRPLQPVRIAAHRLIRRFKRSTKTVQASPLTVPSSNFDRCIFGMAQLAFAGQLMLRRPTLIKAALIPASIFALLCGFLGYVEYRESGIWGTVKHIYLALVTAAPISPILFSRSYAKLAAAARREAGFPERDPYLRSIKAACKETVLQLLVVGAGLAPLYAILGILPFSAISIAIVSAAWTLHWIFIESLDSSRTLPPLSPNPPEISPSHTEKQLLPKLSTASQLKSRESESIRPWYQRLFSPNLRKPWSTFVPPFAAWGRFLARLTQRWRSEVAVAEAHPWMAAGFASGVALILAIPGINLFFRPIVVVAASLLQAKLESQEIANPDDRDKPHHVIDESSPISS